jgi:hypothetical protein
VLHKLPQWTKPLSDKRAASGFEDVFPLDLLRDANEPIDPPRGVWQSVLCQKVDKHDGECNSGADGGRVVVDYRDGKCCIDPQLRAAIPNMRYYGRWSPKKGTVPRRMLSRFKPILSGTNCVHEPACARSFLKNLA